MKTEIKVTELSHENLVDLLSTALYDSNWFRASYDRDIYESLENKQGECFEDKLADMLLAGKKITITDFEADGESYSKKFVRFEGKYQDAVYEVDIKDFLKVASTKTGYKLLREVIGYNKEDGDEYDEPGDGDYYTADAFLQRVVFGEEVYG